MNTEKLTLQPGRVHLRHIKLGVGPGAVVVAGTSFLPLPRKGVNGRTGWQTGEYELRMNEEGLATIRFANAAGDDGQLHRERFDIITKGRAISPTGGPLTYEGGDYRPGDEWIEIYWGDDPDPEFVGTPISARVSKQTVEISLADGLWCLKKIRETAAGFWANAPREVFEAYSRLWRVSQAEGFDGEATYTSGASEVVTGNWKHKQATTVDGSVVIGDGGYFKTVPTVPSGQTDYRVEVRVSAPGPSVAAQVNLRIGFTNSNLTLTGTDPKVGPTCQFSESGGQVFRTAQIPLAPSYHIAIERRDVESYAYVNGVLFAVGSAAGIQAVEVSPPVGSSIRLESIVIRQVEHFLCRTAENGDERLPGVPPAGGLVGTYKDDSDLVPAFAAHGSPSTARRLASRQLVRVPYARRLDPEVNFAGTNPPGWQPVGPAGGRNFSARWTGSIYLDLAATDYRLRVVVAGNAVLRVGETTGKSTPLIFVTGNNVTGTSVFLRSLLGTTSGWFPIRLDYDHGNELSVIPGGVVLQAESGSATFYVVGGTADPSALRPRLSPLGCYEQQVRYESHYDALSAVAESFGYQYLCEPKSLESGEFPGRCVPRVRVGRDTDEIIESPPGVDLAIRADQVADSLLGEGTGLSDNATEVVAELLEFAQLDGHLFLSQEYESLSEISIPELLLQRLSSLLGLRGSPWEEVTAKPRGYRRLVDWFPLTGQLAELKWRPGDGVRLSAPEVGVLDSKPRQILGVKRQIRPGGLGFPEISFRQRPRSPRETLRRFMRQATQSNRNYQRQKTVVVSAFTQNPNFAALPIPVTAEIISGLLVVTRKDDTSAMTVEVNTVNQFVITGMGEYPISVSTFAGRHEIFARLINGTGVADYFLQLTIRI